MIRTQVYLEDRQSKSIKLLSQSKNRSEAEIIRDALEYGLDHLRDQSGNADGLLALAQLGERLGIRDERDAASRIDDYLYGDDTTTTHRNR